MAAAALVAAGGPAGGFLHAGKATVSLLHSTSLGWLLNGQVLMVLMTVCAVYPLSCQKHMRSLEGAAGAGLLIVAALCGLLGFKAWSQGWPAIANGQFPLWSLRVTADLPEAFSLLGFAFYLQPLMMPIIREMPEGKAGRNALTAAVHASVLGSCLVLYAGTGFFGAALFGTSTRGNVMINDILGGSRLGFGVVYGAMMLYLAAGAAASQYPLRAAIDMALMGARVPMTRPRAMAIQAVTLSVSLCIALLNPGGAEKIYALVGASGVCIVCYVLPVWFHLRLMHVRRQAACSQVGNSQSYLHAAQCWCVAIFVCCCCGMRCGLPLHVGQGVVRNSQHRAVMRLLLHVVSSSGAAVSAVQPAAHCATRAACDQVAAARCLPDRQLPPQNNRRDTQTLHSCAQTKRLPAAYWRMWCLLLLAAGGCCCCAG
eukprot:GHRQ01008295.1.p1 GENE.GHRQ01008295.1~~GHRQ01008295.1.p1  ORF type:complete len:441 (+),score=174.27 GHRQ01008295.1:41-1324(+)